MYREPYLQEVPLLVILEVLLLNTDEQFGVGVLLDVHVVLTDVYDRLVRDGVVRRRRTFSHNSRWLLPLQCTLQLTAVSKPLPIAEGGGRMASVALTDRAFGLEKLFQVCET